VARLRFHCRASEGCYLAGLQAPASEVITNLAFYAGWPNALSAAPVANEGPIASFALGHLDLGMT